MYWRIQILEQVLSSLLIECVSVCVCVPHIATIIILCGHSLSLLWSINNLNHIFIDRLLIYLPRIPINPKQQSPFLRISMRPISAAHSPRAAWEQCERGRGVCESALFASLRQQVSERDSKWVCASCLRKQLLSSIVRSRSQLRLVACRRRRRRVVVIAIYSHALFALRRFVSSSCSAANFNSSPKVAR